MESARILIATNSVPSNEKLKQFMAENGFSVVEEATDGNECLRKARTLKPDISLVDFSLPLLSGNEVSKVMIDDGICDVILLVSAAQSSLFSELKGESGFVCVQKPINRPMLLQTIEIMIKSQRKIRQLEQEIEGLKANLDTRKEVEKAKGLLMKNLNLSEGEAFKRIQKQSMDKGIPMREIAKAIILAYDI